MWCEHAEGRTDCCDWAEQTDTGGLIGTKNTGFFQIPTVQAKINVQFNFNSSLNKISRNSQNNSTTILECFRDKVSISTCNDKSIEEDILSLNVT